MRGAGYPHEVGRRLMCCGGRLPYRVARPPSWAWRAWPTGKAGSLRANTARALRSGPGGNGRWWLAATIRAGFVSKFGLHARCRRWAARPLRAV